MKDDIENPPPLDYATRQPRGRSQGLSVVAAVFGTFAGLFGALMLFYGVGGVIWLMGEWKRWKFLDGGDVFEVVMFLLIGLVSSYVSVRWLRASIKGT